MAGFTHARHGAGDELGGGFPSLQGSTPRGGGTPGGGPSFQGFSFRSGRGGRARRIHGGRRHRRPAERASLVEPALELVARDRARVEEALALVAAHRGEALV